MRNAGRGRHTPRGRGIQYAAAYRFNHRCSLEYWVTRPSAQLRTRRVTTTEYEGAFSRRIASEVCWITSRPLSEGAGKTGCAPHPRSRVLFAQTKAHTSIQVRREHPGLPCAMALRLIASSPR